MYDLNRNDDMTGMVGAGELVTAMAISPPPELTPCLCACIGLPHDDEAIMGQASVRGQGGCFSTALASATVLDGPEQLARGT